MTRLAFCLVALLTAPTASTASTALTGPTAASASTATTASAAPTSPTARSAPIASSPTTATAQPRDYLVDVWDAERGLPSSLVTSVAQTPDGYLWVATQNGLLRFDGLRFVAFDPDNTPQLPHARVEHVFVDAAGTLWINTFDGSIASWRGGVFRREWTGAGPRRFEAFLAVSTAAETVFVLDTGALIRRAAGSTGPWQVLRPPDTDLVPVFAQDAAGVLWIKSIDERLWRLEGGGLREAPARGRVGARVQWLTRDGGGRIWIGTEAEVAVFEGDRFRPMTPVNGEARLDVSQIFFTRDGGHWVIANGRARKARGRQWVWTGDAGTGLTGPSPHALNGVEDRRGGIWLSDVGRGLLHVRSDGSARWIRVADGLPGNRIRDLLEDREGNIWLAVDRGGLVRLRDSRFQVFTAAEGLRTPAAASVAEDHDGSIWMGSLGGGLQRYRDGVVTRIPFPGDAAGGFVFSVFPAPNGRLWMSAENEDLYVFDGTRVSRASSGVHGIKAILVDRAGSLWIGAKDGLSRLDGQRHQTFGAADGFERRDVRALAQDPDGAIWMGSSDGAVYRYKDGRFATYRPDPRHGSHPIWSILPDADGTLWIGTFRGGLLRLRDGEFTRYTTDQGLPSNVICQVLDDGAGQLWMGSYNGVFRVAKSALERHRAGAAVPLVSYGRSDGLPTLECSGNYQPSGWTSRDGRLWFATPKGVVSVDPREPATERQPPAVVLEEMRLDQALMKTSPGRPEIPPGPHRLEFQYTGLSLSTPEQVRFRYRLDGLESAWVDAGAARSATYTYVPAGTYRFIVEASLGDGRWSAPSTSQAFTVLPHASETWWFRAGAGLAGVALVAGTVRSITARRLRRRLERLEWQRAIEEDRGRIARDIHDDLGAGLTQITLLSELARRESPHELEAHLVQISDTARELTQAVDEIVWAVNPRQDTLDGLVNYICQFAQEYLTVAGILCRLDVPGHLPPLPLSADVRHNLFLAVKEALNNIVKHAQAREVRLRLIQEQGRLTLVIEDDGRGFDAAAMFVAGATTPATETERGVGAPASGGSRGSGGSGPDSATTERDRYSPGSRTERGAGAPASGWSRGSGGSASDPVETERERHSPGSRNGLGNLASRLAAVGGRCSISSEPGRGTRVELNVGIA